MRKSDSDAKYDLNSIDPEILFNLQKYNWPGNVRELQNVVERMLNFADGDSLALRHLPSDIFSFPASMDRLKIEERTEQQTIKEIREYNKVLKAEWECQEIMRLLNAFDWNISRVAREMNMARSTLYAKMGKYHINV